MKFCTQCDNMYYIGTDSKDSNKLQHYCRNCHHVDNSVNEEGACILQTQTIATDQQFTNVVNKYTKYDPTLPRVFTIKCPNNECNSNKNVESQRNPEVIYIRYNDTEMKYLYVCCECDTTWKTNDATL
jgi:DNA-directed RNA polymerase subunit M/transcription elongation factor TFIIS